MTDKQILFHERCVRSFISHLPHYLYPEQVPLDIEGVTSKTPVPFDSLGVQTFRAMREGDVWGEAWDSAWFRLRGTVPASWCGRTVVARLQLQGEACVFSAAGEPLQGLTNGSIFDAGHARERFPLLAPCVGGESVELLIEAAANGLFGINRDQHPIPNEPYAESYRAAIECARLAVFDEAMFHCWLDTQVLHTLMLSLPVRSPLRARLLHALCQAADAFRHDTPNPAEIRALLAPCLALRGGDAEPATVAVGHAHIDTAWLWPMRETVRKCARTFSSQLQLIERYPGYVFGASQPQLYQFVKDRYPALYARIRAAVAAGRWEAQGAMWVEADTNVPSGESLVRQLLYGKRFYREEFGVDVTNLWLPDVFGYSAALPQILKLAGVDTFLTQKISWSQFNRFPHHTFRWIGIDGTEIVTHFPPEDTYNSLLNPARLRYAAENFEERGFIDEFMTLFGIGDGGGGPREENLETGLRLANLAGCPKVRFGAAQPVLDQLRDRAAELAEWHGELYLELHRGTLTTQARNKRLNRACELALQRTEKLYSCLPFQVYPTADFERLWKIVLTNQFHDIIPGSSIREVYEDSRREYHAVLAELETLARRAADTLRRDEAPASASRITAINTLSQPFHGALHLPDCDAAAVRIDGDTLHSTQPAAAGGVWVPVDLPPLGRIVLHSDAGNAAPPKNAPAPEVQATNTSLENAWIRYEFDATGCLTRIFDKELGRDLMRPGDRGNVLALYEDWPENYDAWDVDITYEKQLRETARLCACEVLEAGPIVATLRLDWRIGASTLRQDVRLSAFSKRLDFVTHVDWRECRKMLRTAFTVDVAAPEATYEIQFGTCRRPTHRNTEWDMARFEVCAHRFADLSDRDQGVALLNDGKYGHKVLERTLDLNLLRAPWFPDPTADRGEHDLTYSILPHAGNLEDSAVLGEAHRLNQPPLLFEGSLDFAPPVVTADATAPVVIDTIKKAEAQDAWVVRLYEPFGRRATCELRTVSRLAEVFETGIMEEPGARLENAGGLVHLNFRPFEIKTLLVKPR